MNLPLSISRPLLGLSLFKVFPYFIICLSHLVLNPNILNKPLYLVFFVFTGFSLIWIVLILKRFRLISIFFWFLKYGELAKTACANPSLLDSFSFELIAHFVDFILFIFKILWVSLFDQLQPLVGSLT
jgi:hypothetical protein